MTVVLTLSFFTSLASAGAATGKEVATNRHNRNYHQTKKEKNHAREDEINHITMTARIVTMILIMALIVMNHKILQDRMGQPLCQLSDYMHRHLINTILSC